MAKRPETRPVRVGVAWFDREQWQRLSEVVPDRNELDDTFERWERNAKKTMKELERNSQLVEKVPRPRKRERDFGEGLSPCQRILTRADARPPAARAT